MAQLSLRTGVSVKSVAGGGGVLPSATEMFQRQTASNHRGALINARFFVKVRSLNEVKDDIKFTSNHLQRATSAASTATVSLTSVCYSELVFRIRVFTH